VRRHGGNPRLMWRPRLRLSLPRGEAAVCRRRARRRLLVVRSGTLGSDARFLTGDAEGRHARSSSIPLAAGRARGILRLSRAKSQLSSVGRCAVSARSGAGLREKSAHRPRGPKDARCLLEPIVAEDQRPIDGDRWNAPNPGLPCRVRRRAQCRLDGLVADASFDRFRVKSRLDGGRSQDRSIRGILTRCEGSGAEGGEERVAAPAHVSPGHRATWTQRVKGPAFRPAHAAQTVCQCATLDLPLAGLALLGAPPRTPAAPSKDRAQRDRPQLRREPENSRSTRMSQPGVRRLRVDVQENLRAHIAQANGTGPRTDSW
jgi:hypothetical protein